MPGGDGTGPLGAGPRTGRGAGYCAGSYGPGHTNSGFGRGWSGRGGGGRGWRHRFFATGLPGWLRFGLGAAAVLPNEDERGMLESRAEMLQQQLDAVRQRLDALKSETDSPGSR